MLFRSDHIYLDPELRDRALGCAIHTHLRGNVQPSDHAPVVVNLAWPPAADDEEAMAADGDTLDWLQD